MTWHKNTQIAGNLYHITEPFGAVEPRFGVKTVNMYLIIGKERAALIDSGTGIGDVHAEIRKLTTLPCTVLNTHFHWDHTGANSNFDDIAIHESEVELLKQEQDVRWLRPVLESPSARAVLPSSFDPAEYRLIPKTATHGLQENDQIDLGDLLLRVIHIPGHSQGHVAFMDEANQVLFTGDTAYLGPMYVCFDGSDPFAFLHSVKRLAQIEKVKLICPGHNDIIQGMEFLGELAQSVEAAVTGKVEGQLREEFIVGQEFSFGAYSVWLPQEFGRKESN